MEKHWTERSIDDFLFKIAADFVAQLEEKMDAENIGVLALQIAQKRAAGIPARSAR